MAISQFNPHHQTLGYCNRIKPISLLPPKIPSHLIIKPRFQFRNSIQPLLFRYKCFCIPNSGCADDLLALNAPKDEEEEGGDEHIVFLDHCEKWILSVRSMLPGGSWWKLSDSNEVGSTTRAARPVTVLLALRRIWALVAGDKWVIYAAFASLSIAAVCVLKQDLPFGIHHLVRHLIVVKLSEISVPNLLAASVFAAQSGETAVFYRNSQLLLLLCLVSGICSGIRSGWFGIANMILLKHLRESLFTALIFQDISFFDAEAVGDLTSRLGGDCQRLSYVIGIDIHLILRNFLQGIGALINLLTLSWPLALSTLVICSVLSIIFLVYGQYQRKAAKFTQEHSARANEVARETFSLMRTVRVYGMEEQEVGRYKHWLGKLASISIRESVAYGFWNLSFNILYRSTQVLAILLGGMSILIGHVSAEQLMKYVLYCEWLIYAAWRVEDNLSSLLRSVGASEKVFQLLVLMPSDQFLSEGMKLQKLVGKIEFVNVSFYYPSRLMVLLILEQYIMEVPVLEHVNISVRPNEMVAIVGLSGSGKSTLVNLLLRLYEPTNGQILVDGFPLTKLDTGWLRDKIGFVGQEPHLFHMDVKSNISYGCLRDIKQEDVEWAAKQARAHEFISSLPNGYETVVDDGLLSGGQKQRIAIARAIVRDPAILILDEATSALDAENEYYIARVLRAFRNDTRAKRTVIVIAHRLSTVKAADRIMVMDRGQVVEMGNHAELLYKDGLYARLVRTKTNALG